MNNTPARFIKCPECGYSSFVLTEVDVCFTDVTLAEFKADFDPLDYIMCDSCEYEDVAKVWYHDNL